MKTIFHNQGQTLAGVLIALVIVGVIAGGLYYYLQKQIPEVPEVAPGEEILEEKIPTRIEYSKERPPRFEDFPILEKFEGAPAPVNLLSHPIAPRFKTALTKGAKEGPNFAGHYTIVSWGCGTMCQVVAVVDAKTGTVYFAPFLTELGAEFRINSNLFVVNPPNEIKEVFGGFEIPDWVYSAYYKWENNQFVNIFDTRTSE